MDFRPCLPTDRFVEMKIKCVYYEKINVLT